MAGVKKLDNKTLTGRYDMKQLIKVQQLEEWFMDQLAELYGVPDADSIPVPVDFMDVLDTDKKSRAAALKDKLVGCPKNPDSLIQDVLKKLDDLTLEEA